MFFPSRSRFHSIPSLPLHSRSSCFQLLSPLASFVRYVQSGIWLSVVKRLYSCLKVLNLSCIYLSPSEENSPPLSVPLPHYTRNLIKALFAPRVLISAARYGIAFPITIKRSSWKHGPLLYSITRRQLHSETVKRGSAKLAFHLTRLKTRLTISCRFRSHIVNVTVIIITIYNIWDHLDSNLQLSTYEYTIRCGIKKRLCLLIR